MRLSKRFIRRSGTLALIVLTAVGIVYSRHESRQLFVELQSLQSQRDSLNVEWGRLQLEQATVAEAGRIERIATSELGLTAMSESTLLELQR